MSRRRGAVSWDKFPDDVQQRIINLCPSEDLFLLKQVRFTRCPNQERHDRRGGVFLAAQSCCMQVAKSCKVRVDSRIQRIKLDGGEVERTNAIVLPENFGARFSELAALDLRHTIRAYGDHSEAVAAITAACGQLPNLTDLCGWPACEPPGDHSPQVQHIIFSHEGLSLNP